VAGEYEPRLVCPRAISHGQADMLRCVAGGVQHIHYDVAEREPVAILYVMDRETHISPDVQG
jgi:hypothetical protein